jgi:hypothetical protein
MQTDTIEALTELLQIEGHAFIFGEDTFVGLLNEESSKEEDFDLSRGDDLTMTITTLSSLAPKLSEGDTFADDEGWNYRIQSICRKPGNPILKFECVVTLLG